jgi:hypothetical protein
MTVSRYTSTHPMFFYLQVKNKIDERTNRDASDVEKNIILLINILMREKHFAAAQALSILSVLFRHAALQNDLFKSNLFENKVFDFYHQSYMNRRNEFDRYFSGKLTKSRARYDVHGSACSMVAHGIFIMMLGVIIAAFLSTYQQLNEKPPADACPSLGRCDFEKVLKKHPKISNETLLQWAFIGTIVGLALSYLARVKMANDYTKDGREYKEYQGKLFFPKPQGLTDADYKALPRDKQLAEKYVCLMRAEDEYHGRLVSKPPIAKPGQ